jgi:hypothetical protein
MGLAVALVFLLSAVGFLYRTAFRAWQGDERTLRRLRISLSALPFGDGVKDGMVRATVALAAQVSCILGAAVSALAGIHGTRRGQLTPGIDLAFAFLGGVVLFFGVQLLIISVNRPSFLVPPSLRGDRGALQKLP